MKPKNLNNKVVVGCLGSVFGVRGQLKVNSYTSPHTNIIDYPDWYIEHAGKWQLLPIEHLKLQGDTIVVKIKGLNDRDEAKAYTNDLIAVERDVLPATETDEYYWNDLIGVTVKTTTGKVLGTIIEMRETGANDVMIIEGDERHLVPFIDSVLESVDLEQQLIVVDWDYDF